MWIVDQGVGVAHDEFVSRRQLARGRSTARAERRAARDTRDGCFVETLLLRTCEAKVLSNAAVHQVGVAQPPDFFRGLIDRAIGP